MKTTLLRAGALSCALLASTALTAPACAQSLLTTPAEKIQTSPGGVDLRTGAYAYNETDISIGGEAGGLALTRTMIQAMAGHSNPFATFSHNWDIMIQELRVNADDPTQSGANYRMLVQYGAARGPSTFTRPIQVPPSTTSQTARWRGWAFPAR